MPAIKNNFIIVNWRGEDYYYQWLNESDPDLQKSKKTLVSGICFDHTGQIMIIKENGELRFPGGSPKSTETFLETLHREIEEEANVLLQNPQLIGGFKVKKANSQQPWSIQLFYIADIKKILTPQIDPESGQIHQRIFIDPADLPKYLRWGKTGDQLFTAALKKYHQFHTKNS